MVHSFPISVSTVRRLLPSAAQVALLAALSLGGLTAQSQPAAKAPRSDPLDPKATVPVLTYESSFSRSRLLAEEKPVSWREANDTVNRIGGWRVYAREAQQPDPTPAAAGASAASAPPAAVPKDNAKPMPPGHGGHKMP